MTARVSYVEAERASEEVRGAYEKVKAATGRVSNLVRILAHFPRGMMGTMGLLSSLREGELDPKLRELAYLKTSRLNGCHY